MPRAFTLVELLVVITIIVILLALLAPAMDQAIYQAELASCAAQVDATLTIGLLYASDHKRHYPIPPDGRRRGHQPDELGAGDTPGQDMRRLLAPYLAMRSYLCPLAAGKIEFDERNNAPDTVVFSTYELWFGMQYHDVNGRGAMRRMGDRFGWNDPQDTLNYFNVLVSDVNIYHTNVFNTQSTHPDREGFSQRTVFQDQGAAEAFVSGGGLVPVLKLTVARWTDAAGRRGFLDQSYGRDDGSVTLFREIGLPDRGFGTLDRFKRVPSSSTNANNVYRIFIPPADR